MRSYAQASINAQAWSSMRDKGRQTSVCAVSAWDEEARALGQSVEGAPITLIIITIIAQDLHILVVGWGRHLAGFSDDA